MKKLLLSLIVISFFGSASILKAQCYGTVVLDTSVSAGVVSNFGNSSFTITTSHCHELIMVAYNGWNGPGSGPVTVNGNPATAINDAITGNSGTASVYAYLAGAAGTYSIVCTETGYNSGYYDNFAAAFYATGTSNLLSIASLTNTTNTIACTTGGSIVGNITTTIPGSMVFCSIEINEGEPTAFPISWTNATLIGTQHTQDGIDASAAYETASTPGTYTITATNSSPPNNGCGGLAIVLVDIPPPLCGGGNMSATVATTQPNCAGNDGAIDLNVSGGYPPYTYVWSPNVSTNANATGLSTGLYSVTILSANDSCSMLTDTIRLTGPTVLLTYKNARCNNPTSGSAQINIVDGQPPFTYTWSNGKTTQVDTGLVLGEYYITVTDSSGCKFKDSVHITNGPPPPIKTAPVADSICYGSSINLVASGGKTYTWLPNRGLSCYNCANPIATPAISTIYTVTGTDTNGCTNTATVNLTVVPLPKPIVTGPDSICIGSAATLDVTGANTYVWNPGAQTGTTVTYRPAATTTYTIKATTGACTGDTTFKVTVVPVPAPKITASKDSVCMGDSLTLSASGASTYRWSPSNSTNKTIHINLSNTTTYTLYGYGGSCADSAKITLKVIPPVSVTATTSKDSICPGQGVTLTATALGGATTYMWSNNATSSSIMVNANTTTTYTVNVNGVCNNSQAVVTVNVVPFPVPIITGTSSKCKGQKDTLHVTSSTNPTTYVWSNGKTGNSIITNSINSNTTITVEAFNSLGCSVIDSFNITAIPFPTATITYPPGCGSNATTITANAQGSGTLTYQWSTGSTNDTINVFVNADTTVYSVIIANDGCAITKKVTVIKDMPSLSACCNTTIFTGGNANIIASGNNIVSYSWAPDTGLNCDTCANVIATPSVTTTYTVIGTDAEGCKTERTVTIQVDIPCFSLEIPNVFTPGNTGGMGMDNIFYIKTENMNAWSLIVFDRWGHEVYKSTNPDQYWDGKTEGGSTAPEGVYYYVIDATCQNTTYKKDGFVQLIR